MRLPHEGEFYPSSGVPNVTARPNQSSANADAPSFSAIAVEPSATEYSLRTLLGRHIAFYGRAPRQAAADGGFATRHDLATAKAWGVSDMAFHKKAGLRIEDMVRSKWVYRKLRNFRAGIEAGISCLKRAYGLARCTWRGLDHFKTYVWSSVVAYNLILFARLKPT